MKPSLLAVCCGLLAGPATAAAPKPNILLIVSDDQGHADVGLQGCKDIPTPHLDQLARDGGALSQQLCLAPVLQPDPRRADDRSLSATLRPREQRVF